MSQSFLPGGNILSWEGAKDKKRQEERFLSPAYLLL